MTRIHQRYKQHFTVSSEEKTKIIQCIYLELITFHLSSAAFAGASLYFRARRVRGRVHAHPHVVFVVPFYAPWDGHRARIGTRPASSRNVRRGSDITFFIVFTYKGNRYELWGSTKELDYVLSTIFFVAF